MASPLSPVTLQFAKPHSAISEAGDDLIVVIPATRWWPNLLVNLFGLALMIVVILSIFPTALEGEPDRVARVAFVLGIPALMLILLSHSVAWSLFGSEIIRAGPHILSLRNDILGLGLTRRFDVRRIQRWRVSPFFMHNSQREMGSHPFSRGIIAFDCGMKTFRLGKSIDEAEAQAIIERLKEHNRYWGIAASEVSAGSQTRIAIDRSGGGLRISIPPKRSWLHVPLQVVWVCVWSFGAAMSVASVLQPNIPTAFRAMFFLPVLPSLAATAIGAMLLAFNVVGRETILVAGGLLRIRTSVFGLGWEREFDLTRVAEVRVMQQCPIRALGGLDVSPWLRTLGLVQAENGTGAVRFGRLITEAEAYAIVEAIQGRVGP